VNNQGIANSFASFLTSIGISERRIRKSNADTRLYHDLGLYGDTARWFVEDLAKKIDMSRFCFERYFPPEFYGESFLASAFYSCIPFVSALRRKRESYTPITLGMVSMSLEKGEWIDP
jgi:hypothetical protein